jgi:uncharacterized membrane protein
VNKRIANFSAHFLIALMFAIAMWAIDSLPPGAQIAVHWGPDFVPDRWMGKWAALLFNPFLALFLWFVALPLSQGVALPGKIPMPEHVRRAMYLCVLLIQNVVQTYIAFKGLRV